MEDPLIGTTLDGRYEILSVIGEGATGIVYKARHQLMDKPVAVKVLRSLLLSDPDARKRFQREAKAVSSLSHPNIVAVHDFGETAEQTPFMVMDFLEGKNLQEELSEAKTLPPPRVANIFLQVCSALGHAHENGMIHRDIKPTNIVVVKNEDSEEIAKLVDFGMSRFLPESGNEAQQLTQTGKLQGDPLYMSPEQFLGRQLDARSDIYSLGCVMYKAITGRSPFEGEQLLDVMREHITDLPPAFADLRPDPITEPELEKIVLKALKKKPDERYQSAGEMRQELQLLAPSENSTAAPLRKKALSGRPKNIKSAIARVSLLLLIAGIAGLAWLAFTESGNIQCSEWWLTYQKASGQPPEQIESTLINLADLYKSTGDLTNVKRKLDDLGSIAVKHKRDFLTALVDRYHILAKSYLDKRDVKNAGDIAVKASQFALSAYSDPTPDFNLREAATRLGRSKELLVLTGNVRSRNLVVIEFFLGQAQGRLNHLETSEREYENAVRICETIDKSFHDSVCTDALIALACTQRLLHHDAQAQASMEKYVRFRPVDPMLYASGLGSYANACAIVKSHHEALKWRLLVHNIRPKTAAAQPDYLLNLYSIAETYNSLGEVEKALPFYLEAATGMEQFKNQDSNRYVHFMESLGKAYWRLGDTKSTQDLFDRLKPFARAHGIEVN